MDLPGELTVGGIFAIMLINTVFYWWVKIYRAPKEHTRERAIDKTDDLGVPLVFRILEQQTCLMKELVTRVDKMDELIRELCHHSGPPTRNSNNVRESGDWS